MGGGSASGAVSWPTYLQDAQADWLTRGVPVEIDYCVTDIMNTAQKHPPWLGDEAYNPDTILVESGAAIAVFASMLSGLDEVADWLNFYSQVKTTLAAPPDGIVVDDFEVDDLAEVVDLEVDDMTAVGDLVIADSVAVTDATGVTDAAIILDVDALSDQLDDELLIKVLPRFKRGMQDINAVVSSAYVIGSSNIEGFRTRDVAKHDSALRVSAAMKNADVDVANMGKDVQIGLGNMNKDTQVGLGNLNKDTDVGKVNTLKDVDVGKANLTKDLTSGETNVTKNLQVGIANLRKNTQVGEINLKSGAEYERMYLEGTSQLISLLAQKLSMNDSLSRLTVDSNRIKIVALKEQKDMNLTIDDANATWDLNVFQYGSNLIASSSGGVGQPGSAIEKPSAAVSGIGGALGGATAGAQIGGTTSGGYGALWGAGIGAVVGAAGGLIARNN